MGLSNSFDDRPSVRVPEEEVMRYQEFIPSPGAILTLEGIRYELIQRLGSGTFGECWTAKEMRVEAVFDGGGASWTFDPSGTRIVKLKFAHDPVCAAALRKEAAILEGLSHRGIAQFRCFDADVTPPVVVMEYVPGRTLRQVLEDDGLDSEEVVRIFADLLQILRYAHTNGVIHRDVKPENIIVQESGEIKLIDFGLGKVKELSRNSLAASGTASGNVVGTPDYMAPEQRRGEKVGPRADLYAAGLILFEMLTGRLPDRTEKPSDLDSDIPRYLDQIYMRCCTTLERRYNTAGEVLVDLERRCIPSWRLALGAARRGLRRLLSWVLWPPRLLLRLVGWIFYLVLVILAWPLGKARDFVGHRLGRHTAYEILQAQYNDANEGAKLSDALLDQTRKQRDFFEKKWKKRQTPKAEIAALRPAPVITRTMPYEIYDREPIRTGKTQFFHRIPGKSSEQTNLAMAHQLPFGEKFEYNRIEITFLTQDPRMLDRLISNLALELRISCKRIYGRPLLGMTRAGNVLSQTFPSSYCVGRGETFDFDLLDEQHALEEEERAGIVVQGLLSGQITPIVQ